MNAFQLRLYGVGNSSYVPLPKPPSPIDYARIEIVLVVVFLVVVLATALVVYCDRQDDTQPSTEPLVNGTSSQDLELQDTIELSDAPPE